MSVIFKFNAILRLFFKYCFSFIMFLIVSSINWQICLIHIICTLYLKRNFKKHYIDYALCLFSIFINFYHLNPILLSEINAFLLFCAYYFLTKENRVFAKKSLVFLLFLSIITQSLIFTFKFDFFSNKHSILYKQNNCDKKFKNHTLSFINMHSNHFKDKIQYVYIKNNNSSLKDVIFYIPGKNQRISIKKINRLIEQNPDYSFILFEYKLERSKYKKIKSIEDLTRISIEIFNNYNKENKQNDIIICGHSLGGAVAIRLSHLKTKLIIIDRSFSKLSFIVKDFLKLNNFFSLFFIKIFFQEIDSENIYTNIANKRNIFFIATSKDKVIKNNAQFLYKKQVRSATNEYVCYNNSILFLDNTTHNSMLDFKKIIKIIEDNNK